MPLCYGIKLLPLTVQNKLVHVYGFAVMFANKPLRGSLQTDGWMQDDKNPWRWHVMM